MKDTILWIFIQLLGILGITASILSFQCKGHKRLVILRTLNEFFFGIQYFLLGAYTGMAMNAVGCVRNLFFAKMVENKKSTVGIRVFFSLLFLTFTAFTWAGAKSILIGIAKVISTFAYGSSNVFLVRIMIFLTSSAWLVYNIFVGSYAGVVCEALSLASIIVGIIRIDIPELKRRKFKA